MTNVRLRRLSGMLLPVLLILGGLHPASALELLVPLETIGYGGPWGDNAVRRVPEGGRVLVILRLDDAPCDDIVVSGADPELSVFVPVDLPAPSTEGEAGGTHYDLLVPRGPETCALSPYVLAEWVGTGAGTVTLSTTEGSVAVEVEIAGPLRPDRRPFLMGLTASYIMAAHCDPSCPPEVPLARSYADLLASHHVQPIQSWIRFPPVVDGRLDLDAGGEGSFRNMVMAYAGDGPVGFPRARWYDDRVSYLQALERTVREEGLVGRAWVYAVDEPPDIDALAEELALYRRHAPSVRVMVTTSLDDRLEGLVDIYAPVLNRLGRDGWPDASAYAGYGLWPYVSCMGACGPNRAAKPDVPPVPGPDTGLPDFLIDRPAERLFAYFRELDEIDADAGLYFIAVEGHRLALQGIDVLADPWNFGGNGHGVLIYPGKAGMFGLDEDQPLPSWRLKLMAHAIETLW